MSDNGNGLGASEMEKRLLATDDVMVWAEEFRRVVVDQGTAIDEGLIVGWFANLAVTAQRIQRERIEAVLKSADGIEDRRRHAIAENIVGTDTNDLEELVFQALGAASMCWDPTPGDCVFNSTEAAAIGYTLIEDLKPFLKEVTTTDE